MGEDWSDVIRHHAHAPSVGAVVIPRWRGRWQKAKCATVAVHRRFLSPFRNLQSDRVFSTLCNGRFVSVVAKKVNIGVGSCRFGWCVIEFVVCDSYSAGFWVEMFFWKLIEFWTTALSMCKMYMDAWRSRNIRGDKSENVFTKRYENVSFYMWIVSALKMCCKCENK